MVLKVPTITVALDDTCNPSVEGDGVTVIDAVTHSGELQPPTALESMAHFDAKPIRINNGVRAGLDLAAAQNGARNRIKDNFRPKEGLEIIPIVPITPPTDAPIKTDDEAILLEPEMRVDQNTND